MDKQGTASHRISVSVLLTAILILGSIPVVQANHFSVGTYDAAGIQPTEGPGDASIPADGDLYERGISLQDQSTGQPCASYSGSLANATTEAQASTQADPFCGQLVYNKDTAFNRTSPVDQDYPLEALELEFDTVMMSFVGVGLGWCPAFWCFPATADAFQDAAATTGLTDNASAYHRKAGSPTENQGYGPNMGYPNAYMVAHSSSGAFEGNGWTGPNAERSFLAFLSSPTDDSIDDTELSQLVAELKSQGKLPATAQDSICAFTPDASVSISAGSESFCEITFTYYSDENEPDPAFDDYESYCSSPTYLCGANQPGWYANLVMLPRPACRYDCPIEPVNQQINALGLPGPTSDADQASQSTNDYDVWHFVVAPTASPCQGAAEPGFAIEPTDVGSSATAPYLAHDLDIYTPIGSAAGLESLGSTDVWQEQVVNRLQNDGVSAVTDTLPDLPPQVEDVVTTANDASYVVLKDDLQEPNAPGDTSQATRDLPAGDNTEELTRTLATDDCSVFSPDETLADPWVNYMDTTLQYDYAELVYWFPPHVDTTATKSQDASNTGTTGFYRSSGHIGMVTDKDDDGEYAWASGETANKGETINSVGAYPLWMDMQAEKDSATGDWRPIQGGGCSMGFDNTRLTDAMVEAGYGVHTGVIKVIYLQEPAVLVDLLSGNQQVYPAGETAFVFMNQAFSAMYQDGDLPTQQLVAAALSKAGLEPSLADKPAQQGGYNLEMPGQAAGFASDFQDQCRAETGEISLRWAFSHDCTLGCDGDVIVTAYHAELTRADGSLGGGAIPVFDPDSDGTGFDFHALDANDDGIMEIYDVDPFTGDPDDGSGPGQSPPADE